MRSRLCILVLSGGLVASAHAQLRLPGLSLPAVPLQALPLQSAVSPLDRASDLRHLANLRLVRENRRLIDTDPRGDPIVRGDILALSPSADALRQAQALGFAIDRETGIDADLRVTVLRVPAGMSARHALDTLRRADPAGSYDYNHIYAGAGIAESRRAGPAQSPAAPETQAAESAEMQRTAQAGASKAPVRVGLLDTGVDASHPVFAASTLHPWGCAGSRVPGAHGTGVASLLLAHGAVELYAADVYCGVPTGGAVDAIVAALTWLAGEQVPVINISLVGPRNLLLEHVVGTLVGRGYLIVAAVGNDGPTAPPLYPAAYPHVIGVTGVDARRRVLLEAGRGPQVTFAAFGADIKAAGGQHDMVEVRGTSFAAPVVAALLAEAVTVPAATNTAAVDALAMQAIDLGPPGKDLTYGYGLVGVAER